MAETPEQIAARHEERLLKDMDSVSDKLYAILLKEIAKLTVNGKLTADNKAILAQLEPIIKEALKDAGYTKAMDAYFTGYQQILQQNDDYYQKQGISLRPLLGDTAAYNNFRETTVENLRGAGVNKEVIKPLADMIRQGAFLNSSFSDAADMLRNTLVENKMPTRYVHQITKDALMMYDGAIQDEIRVRTGATHFYYIGSEIETTRPFCAHMKDKYGSRKISFDEVEADLNEFCPGGVPSKEETTYTTVSGEKHTKRKGSGMMENTFTYNFATKRGGHECRHEVKIVIPSE